MKNKPIGIQKTNLDKFTELTKEIDLSLLDIHNYTSNTTTTTTAMKSKTMNNIYSAKINKTQTENLTTENSENYILNPIKTTKYNLNSVIKSDSYGMVMNNNNNNNPHYKNIITSNCQKNLNVHINSNLNNGHVQYCQPGLIAASGQCTSVPHMISNGGGALTATQTYQPVLIPIIQMPDLNRQSMQQQQPYASPILGSNQHHLQPTMTIQQFPKENQYIKSNNDNVPSILSQKLNNQTKSDVTYHENNKGNFKKFIKYLN